MAGARWAPVGRSQSDARPGALRQSEKFQSPEESQGLQKSPRTSKKHRAALELPRPRQSSLRSDWPSGVHTLDVWSSAQLSPWLEPPVPPYT